MDLKLEVVVIPVSDVDRSKAFYEQLGFRLDADFRSERGLRVVQLTPPGSAASIIFGEKLTTAEPGSTQGLHLITTDINGAREQLRERGAEVSELGTTPTASSIGPEPTTASRARTRLPTATARMRRSQTPTATAGCFSRSSREPRAAEPRRTLTMSDDAPVSDAETFLRELLTRTAEAHGRYERDELGSVYDENWPQWYAAYMAEALAADGYAITPCIS